MAVATIRSVDFISTFNRKSQDRFDLITANLKRKSIKLRSRPSPNITKAYYGSLQYSDPHHTLGVDVGASHQEIKKAYRRLALQFHPDVCKGDSCKHQFMKINQAYELLALGHLGNDQVKAHNPYMEGMMGVNDSSWQDWEEWMGWEGAGTRDYSSHINF